jgi:rRNA maturation endonuclease Nob1
MVQIEQQFQALLNRLARVQAAEVHLPEALRLTEADLARAERLRDQEDIKIGPEVDHQLDQAREHLAKATRLMADGQFLTAVEEQATARQLATAAYVAADEQVREINTRQTMLEMAIEQGRKQVAHCQAELEQLSVVVQTMSTRRLVQQLQEKEAQAEQARLATTDLEDRALAQALETAVERYNRLSQHADWVAQQIATDQVEYDRLLSQTLATVAEARAALRQTKQAMTQTDPSGAGQRALYRAEQALPSVDDSKQATRAALKRMQQQAEAVILYAKQGEQLAHRKRRLSPVSAPPEPDEERKVRLKRLSTSETG